MSSVPELLKNRNNSSWINQVLKTPANGREFPKIHWKITMKNEYGDLVRVDNADNDQLVWCDRNRKSGC